MSVMNTKYTEIELCTTVLNAVNITVLTACFAAVQNEFPIDITKLNVQLTRVCDQNKEHKRLLNDLASKMRLKTNVGPEDQASMNSAREALLCKTKDRKCGGRFPASATSSTTRGRNTNDTKGGGYALCKKYSTNSPNAWKTAPTKDCKKYNKDGATKLFKCGNIRNSAPYNDKKSAFANLKREEKSAKRRGKKMKRTAQKCKEVC